jgi:hypothetical protein
LAKVGWSDIADIIQKVYEANGRIERADAVAEAENRDASDDVIDAVDAIGSRVFNTPELAKGFLVTNGYVDP